jgi:DNA-binding protein HU-beta
MNKNELVSAVAEEAGLEKSRAQAAVDAVFSVISKELKRGGDVRLVGFGNFSVTKRAASTGRNPQTGAEVKIPARSVPKFSAGKGLKDAVNG